MTGIVDDYGRALVRITIRHPESSASAEWDAWIDTGFTGELLLTPEQADALGLPRSSAVPGTLADGSQIQFEARRCFVEWFGVSRTILPIIGTGRFALIGVGLLEDLNVAINYPARTVSLLPGTSSTSGPPAH
jgi:clan AA aspartic protease